MSVTKEDLKGFAVCKNMTEKLYDIFLNRYRAFWDDAGSGMREHDIVDMWEDWLRDLKGVEHIKKFSMVGDAVDYLLEKVNEPGWNRVAIRDPSDNKRFILVDGDFAERALVLGAIP